MIVMIDNYDSFTYNLVQYLRELGEELKVVRNDAITIEQLASIQPEYIFISPGPGNPDTAGISLEVVRQFAGKIPILGVCLGHQTIVQAWGGEVIRAERLMHGKVSSIFHDGETIFRDIPSPYQVARYHSLVVNRETLPEEFMISAETAEGEIMAIRHRKLPLEGVQFHPEAILSEHGKQLLDNFIHTYRSGVTQAWRS